MRMLHQVVIAGLLAVMPTMAFAEDIRIGVLNDRSGPYSDAAGAGSAIAAQMAAEKFGNEINGNKIVIFAADHQNKPDLASAVARRWFDGGCNCNRRQSDFERGTRGTGDCGSERTNNTERCVGE